MDVLVPIPMKSAAKCDKQCELQNSANHQILERKWRWRDLLPACLFQCLKTSKKGVFLGIYLSWCVWLKKYVSAYFLLSHTNSCMHGSLGPSNWSSIYSVISMRLKITQLSIECIEISPTKWHNHLIQFCIWNQARTPAELKHINKRRKRN